MTDHLIWRAAQVGLVTSLHLRKSITAIPNEPIFLIDTPNFKALVVGLETGGQIPAHPGEAAMYHFLEGAGLDNPVLRQPICVFYPDESCHYSHASPFGNFATLTSRNLS